MTGFRMPGTADTIAELIMQVHEVSPELRVGQVLQSAAKKAGWVDEGLFYCPDSMLIAGLHRVLDELKTTE